MTPQPYIVCPKCGRVSHNPNDVEQRYCGNCHAFHDNRPPEVGRELRVSELQPRTIVWLAKQGRNVMATVWVVEIGEIYVHFRAGAVSREFFAERRGPDLEEIHRRHTRADEDLRISGGTVIPDRIARLPKDRRGYPIPWNVLRGIDGTALFTINDDRKHLQCLRSGLCPICGERLGKWKWFTGGPRSAFDPHGWYRDLPMHHECARFALATCPYLSAPRYDGRVDVIDPSNLPPEARVLLNETVIPERPLLFVAVASDKVELSDNRPFMPSVRPVRPVLAYEFWHHGQQIPVHRAMPILRGILGADWALPAVRS